MSGSRSGVEVRHELYDIMRKQAAFEEKAKQALALGEKYLGVDNVHLTRIEPEADYWEAIASTDDDTGDFPPGMILDYQTTYCRRVLADNASIALHDAPAQGWQNDPAFKTHGLHCYHGTPIIVSGDVFGTVCFVSEAPREQPFDEADTTFAELLARLLEHELERGRHKAEITRRANSITVLSRVLRHNLRNDMIVIRSHISRLADRLNGDSEHLKEQLFTYIDDIIDLSDKARKLETIVSTQYDREPVALEALLERIVGQVTADYPTAEIAIVGQTDVTLDVMPSFELALTELVENAADHAGPDAHVVIENEPIEEAVALSVVDDGPGLPEQEREVLAEGVETPLVHGSGLGLWMVYWIVASHDGRIDAIADDDGTTVTVTVPRFTTDNDRLSDGQVRTLQQGFDRFQAVFEESFDAMVIVDDDRRIIDANDGAAALFDRPRSDLLGRTVGEFASERFDADRVWAAFQAEGHHEGQFPLEVEAGERIVEYSAAADIVPGQHLLVGRDVTERIKRERRFEALAKGFPGLCFIIDEAGVYREVLASPVSEDRLYADSEALLGESLQAVLPEETAGLLTREIEATLAAEEARSIRYELAVPAGDREFEATLYPLAERIEGRRAVSMVVRDVTDEE